MEDEQPEGLDRTIEDTIEDNDVVLFIKGEKDDPYCGFSERALLLTYQYVEEAEVVNVLDELEAYRDSLEEHSSRRTIPQVFVQGEFIGGSDVLLQLEKQGELEQTLQVEHSEE